MTKNAAMCICPGCGTYGSLEAFAAGPDASMVAVLFGELQPDVAKALRRYLVLFQPAKHLLTWSRTRRLIEQLVPSIQAERVTFNGRDWPAPRSAWVAALYEMADNPTLKRPLKNHNYLLTIITGQADKIEAAAEAATEKGRQTASAERKSAPQVVDDERRNAHQLTLAAAELGGEVPIRNRIGQPTDRASLVAHLICRGYDQAIAARATDKYIELSGANR
jgi:hypothetical protein